MSLEYLTNGTVKILMVNISVIVTTLYILNLFRPLRSFGIDQEGRKEVCFFCAITYALAGIAVMQFPLFPDLQGHIDLRMVPLILCGYYHGAKTGTIACSLVFIYRYWLGGEEVPISTIYLLCGVVSSYARSLTDQKAVRGSYISLVFIGLFFLVLAYVFVYLFFPAIFPIYVDLLIPRVIATVLCLLLGVTIANSSIRMNAIQEELRFYASTDVLSGLHNRRCFEERLRTLRERSFKHNEEFSVALIDIDHFKRFNDSYGHIVGDQLITQLSQVIQSSVSSSAVVARYGGEEFAVLLPETNAAMAKKVCGQMLSRVCSNRFSCFGKSGDETVTISVGIATYPGDGLSESDVMAHADEALYQAKNSGRNKVVSYRRIKDVS